MRLLLGIVFLGVLGSGSAHAQPYGGYCSASSYSGRWAMWFGNGGIRESCAVVYDALLAEGETVSARRTGYYSLYGWNQVRVSCSNYQGVFSGLGAYPAQEAYQAATWASGQYCLFTAVALN